MSETLRKAHVDASCEYLADHCWFVPKTDGPGDADFGDACLAIQEAFIAGAQWQAAQSQSLSVGENHE